MSNRVLDEKELNALISKDQKEEYLRTRRDWISFESLNFAAGYSLEQVVMNGVSFDVTHDLKRQSMFVHKSGDFIPCGHFKYEDIRRYAEIESGS